MSDLNQGLDIWGNVASFLAASAASTASRTALSAASTTHWASHAIAGFDLNKKRKDAVILFGIWLFLAAMILSVESDKSFIWSSVIGGPILYWVMNRYGKGHDLIWAYATLGLTALIAGVIPLIVVEAEISLMSRPALATYWILLVYVTAQILDLRRMHSHNPILFSKETPVLSGLRISVLLLLAIAPAVLISGLPTVLIISLLAPPIAFIALVVILGFGGISMLGAVHILIFGAAQVAILLSSIFVWISANRLAVGAIVFVSVNIVFAVFRFLLLAPGS